MFVNTRKIRRARARLNMQREGVQRMNKRPMATDLRTGLPIRLSSLFSDNWREESKVISTKTARQR